MTQNNEQDAHVVSHAGERHKVSGMIQLIVVVIFVVVAVVVSGTLNLNKKTPGEREKEERTVIAEAEVIKPQSYRIAFSTTGVVNARAQIAVVPQVSGQVISVNENFFNGGTLKPKEVLFEIEPLDYALEVERLEAEVTRAETAYNLELAESNAAISGWKQINKDAKIPPLVARTPQKAEAQANLNAAKAQLENAKLDLGRTKFTLPFTSRVLSSSLDVGQYVSAGQQYGSVYDISALEVKISLEDKKLDWIMSAQDPEIKIKTNYLGQKKQYNGKIKRGVSSLDTQTRFATLNIGFETPPLNLVPGIFVDLDITGPELNSVYIVPIGAVQKGSVLWAVDNENTLFKIDAEIVYADDHHVILRGPQNPLKIVTSKLSGVAEGMHIKLLSEQEQNNEAAPSQENATSE